VEVVRRDDVSVSEAGRSPLMSLLNNRVVVVVAFVVCLGFAIHNAQIRDWSLFGFWLAAALLAVVPSRAWSRVIGLGRGR